MDVAVSVRRLRKSYNGREVFRDLSLDVAKEKITAIFGPNGSGKSTLFNVLAGVLPKDGGDYSLAASHFSYVFQNYRDTLLPWRSARTNIAFPLQIKGLSQADREQRVIELVKQFNVSLDLDVYPYELSGGQQQIVVFLRSLITKPDLLLLDEPFSALDYENTLRLRNELQEYYLATKATVFIITHDIEEAVHLASDIVVFSSSPTRILGTVQNDMPYPRTVDAMKIEPFHRVKNEVLELFQSAVKI